MASVASLIIGSMMRVKAKIPLQRILALKLSQTACLDSSYKRPFSFFLVASLTRLDEMRMGMGMRWG